MSFSSTTKSELARIIPLKKCCCEAELVSFWQVNGAGVSGSGKKRALKFNSENAAVARKIFRLAKGLLGTKPRIYVSKRSSFKKNNIYTVYAPVGAGMADEGSIASFGQCCTVGHPGSGMESCCRKSYLRGSFLAGGSIANPHRTYHMEVTVPGSMLADMLVNLMRAYGLKPGITLRKTLHIVYLKESEQIAHFLNIVGAHSALLQFENIRIYKGMRNRVNRLVNCETANMNKSINAALEQIENIRLIQAYMGLGKLPKNLRLIAALRLENPEASLKELGEMLDPPIGKSGVNHRMRKIEEVAERFREKRVREE